MSAATNGIGFEVQSHDTRLGWRRASRVMNTQSEAQTALKVANDSAAADASARGTVDMVERRWFESLEGFV